MKKQIPSKGMAAFLGIVFGTLGVHLIYLRNPAAGAVWLIICILFSWTMVVPLVLAGLGLLQGISYLFWTDADWEARFAS